MVFIQCLTLILFGYFHYVHMYQFTLCWSPTHDGFSYLTRQNTKLTERRGRQGIKSETWLACVRAHKGDWVGLQSLLDGRNLFEKPLSTILRNLTQTTTRRKSSVLFARNLKRLTPLFFLFEHAKPPVERSSVHEDGMTSARSIILSED
jgi:hypothetical protein